MALPSGYTKLDYIESSGTQYINTGFKPNQNTRCVIDIENLSSAQAAFFGARANQNAASFTYFSLTATTGRSDYGSSKQSMSFTNTVGRYTVDQNKNVCTANGVTATGTANTFQLTNNLYLMAVNQADAATQNAKLKLYSAKIYDNGTLVRDFIPCKNANGTLGLWDNVNSVFYANAGKGTFSTGKKHKTLINGTGYEIKSGRVLIAGTGYDIKKGRTLIGGTGYDIKFGTPVGELAVGSSVYMNVGGVRKKFIVINQGTASGGFYSGDAGATWVLMNEKYKEVQQEVTSSEYFSNTPVYTDANTTFLNSLDVGVREQIASLTYPDMCYHFADKPKTIYVTGKIVILRSQDLGEDGWADGEKIPMKYFSDLKKNKRILYDANGTTKLRWHLQDYSYNINSPYHRPRVIDKAGDIDDDGSSYITAIIRPAFAFNASTQIDSDFNIIPA